MYRLIINYFISFSLAVIILLYCGSCASLSDKYLHEIEKGTSLRTPQTNKEYIFENSAFYVRNRVVLDSTENTPYKYNMLWRCFDPRFDTDRVDWAEYQVKIEIISDKKLKVKLLSSSGEIIKERTLKYDKTGPYYKIKPKFWLWNNYILVNGFESQISALSLSSKDDLVIVKRSVDGAFLIVMPFAGSETSDVYHYKPISIR